MGGYTASTSNSCSSFCTAVSYVSLPLPNGIRPTFAKVVRKSSSWELKTDIPSFLKRIATTFESDPRFDSFFEIKVKLTDPISSIGKGLVAFVSCSWLNSNVVQIDAIVRHSKAGLDIRKGFKEKTMSRTRLRFLRQELTDGERDFDASNQYYHGHEGAVDGEKC
jgi:hypothetical protein